MIKGVLIVHIEDKNGEYYRYIEPNFFFFFFLKLVKFLIIVNHENNYFKLIINLFFSKYANKLFLKIGIFLLAK